MAKNIAHTNKKDISDLLQEGHFHVNRVESYYAVKPYCGHPVAVQFLRMRVRSTMQDASVKIEELGFYGSSPVRSGDNLAVLLRRESASKPYEKYERAVQIRILGNQDGPTELRVDHAMDFVE